MIKIKFYLHYKIVIIFIDEIKYFFFRITYIVCLIGLDKSIIVLFFLHYCLGTFYVINDHVIKYNYRQNILVRKYHAKCINRHKQL